MTIQTAESDMYVVSNQCVDLVNIYNSETQLCQWQPGSCRERKFYGTALAEREFNFKRIVGTSSLAEVWPSFPVVRGFADFKAWLQELVDVFADLFGLNQVGLRIASSHKPMCPRFHFDQVPARLIHPLSGDGCEWIDAGHSGFKADLSVDSLAKLTPDKKEIRKAPPGSVVIMKGSTWSDTTPPVIHRSPNHAGARSVLTLDFA